jgi:hypothetical protein
MLDIPNVYALGCVTDFLNVNYALQAQNNSLPNCSIPWLISLLGIDYPKEQIICSPEDDILLWKHFGSLNLMADINLHRLKECLQPCIIISFTAQFNPSDIYSGTSVLATDFIDNPRIFLFLYYVDPNIEVSNQVKLITFNGFISSFGGSLGLFLGFSCLPTLLMIKNFFSKL